MKNLKQKVDQIAECVFSEVQKMQGQTYGLYAGEFGKLLFMLYYLCLQLTQRRTYNETFVGDAGICHGSAGVAMLFRRMFLDTKRDEFSDATAYWINSALSFSRFEDGLAGYKTREKDGWKCDYSLLGGIAGIGLVLLSYLVDDEQKWDECFLLS